jgi:TolA-binding protein
MNNDTIKINRKQQRMIAARNAHEFVITIHKSGKNGRYNNSTTNNTIIPATKNMIHDYYQSYLNMCNGKPNFNLSLDKNPKKHLQQALNNIYLNVISNKPTYKKDAHFFVGEIRTNSGHLKRRIYNTTYFSLHKDIENSKRKDLTSKVIEVTWNSNTTYDNSDNRLHISIIQTYPKIEETQQKKKTIIIPIRNDLQFKIIKENKELLQNQADLMFKKHYYKTDEYNDRIKNLQTSIESNNKRLYDVYMKKNTIDKIAA